MTKVTMGDLDNLMAGYLHPDDVAEQTLQDWLTRSREKRDEAQRLYLIARAALRRRQPKPPIENKPTKFCKHGCKTHYNPRWNYCPVCGYGLLMKVLPKMGDTVLVRAPRVMTPNTPGGDVFFKCEVTYVKRKTGIIGVYEPGLVVFDHKKSEPQRREEEGWYDLNGYWCGVDPTDPNYKARYNEHE